jgi:hypothetical protein
MPEPTAGGSIRIEAGESEALGAGRRSRPCEMRRFVAARAAETHTLLFGNTSTQVLIPAVMSKPPYAPLKDFTGITILCSSPITIVVHHSVPARNLAELIAYAKTNPGKLSYGSAGAGTLTNLAGKLFKQLIGAPDIVHIPYHGSAPGLTDLASGQIPMIDEVYHLIKNTPKVTGFLGTNKKPLPISEAEATYILHQIQEGIERPKPLVSFEVGEQVYVSDGPFYSFNAIVEEVDHTRSRLKVAVSVFGRATPIELEFSQVQKV